jgi:hypothetical protein
MFYWIDCLVFEPIEHEQSKRKPVKNIEIAIRRKTFRRKRFGSKEILVGH